MSVEKRWRERQTWSKRPGASIRRKEQLLFLVFACSHCGEIQVLSRRGILVHFCLENLVQNAWGASMTISNVASHVSLLFRRIQGWNSHVSIAGRCVGRVPQTPLTSGAFWASAGVGRNPARGVTHVNTVHNGKSSNKVFE